MKRYRIEVAKYPQSSFCTHSSEIVDVKDAHEVAEAIAPNVEEVRIMEIETTETQIRRFSISENART